jgi:hypothetical protein
MRPEKDTIAAPDLPTGITWIGEAPQSMPAATAAGPVLVHFFDYSQLNSVRTLPYAVEWDRRYRDAGLTTIGVQSPRFPFGADPIDVATGLRDLGVEFPVAIDSERDLWHAYGCEGWPSLFLWTTGGALSWFHFGEGEYLGTEEAIQDELRQLDALQMLPEPMEPLRATDAPGVTVRAPSNELIPTGSLEEAFVVEREDQGLEIPYAAGGVYVTAEGEGEIRLVFDNVPTGSVEVKNPGLYPLAEHEWHEAHRIRVLPKPGMRIWSVSFAPGMKKPKPDEGSPKA